MAWSDFPGISQLKRFWQRCRHSIAQEVPERVAKCEFDCGRVDCAPDDIRDCHARVEYAEAEKGQRTAVEPPPHGD